jgi:TolB protein
MRTLNFLVMSLAVAISAWPQAANSPNGIFESAGDIGTTPRSGSLQFNAASGEYRITGGGANIWGKEDAFHFVWRRLSGDATITADISFIGTGAVAHRKALLMFRQDLTPDSAYADAALHGDGLTSLQYRAGAGAATQEIQSTTKGPVRIRIERRGNRFTMFAGNPGGDMIPSGPQTVEMKDPVYLGLGVCSHDADVLETAVFANVRFETPRPAPAQQQYRSRITIYDLAARTTRVVYQADQVFEAPNWSQDGKFLIVNTAGNLYRLPVEGEPKLEQINVGAGYRCNNDHVLTLDGKLLGFSAAGPNERVSQVYVAQADGSGVRQLTSGASASYFHGWSPDNRWLAFVGQRNGKFELYRVPAAGGPEQRLTFTGGYDDGPEYTPDGRWIYFNSNRGGSWNVWRMPVDGAGPNDEKAQQVTSDAWEDWFPHISPDGKWMVVFAFPQGTETHNDRMEGVVLRLMPTPGQNPKSDKLEILTKFFGGQGTINVNSWSPDSKKFAYVVYEKF